MSPKIRWAHACNSMQELELALGTGLEAIEADVCWNENGKTAVMKHASTSKEPIEKECLAYDWLMRALSVDRTKIKILKLDFKNLRAVPNVVDILEKNLKDDSPEIMLNADILVGPGAKPHTIAPVDSIKFLEYCERIPNATLSLGWTTAYSPFETLCYEPRHVDAMLGLLDSAKHSRVTFPIRASLAFESWPALSRLLGHSQHASITLWTAHEGVPLHQLEWIISQCQEHQIYVDCDKGPKHPYWHPMRLFQYDWTGIFLWYTQS